MNNSELLRHSKVWDRAGIFISGLCIVHCALFPLLILMLPATRAFLGSEILEAVILFMGILVGSISFTTSYRKHRKPTPIMIGLTGVALLTLDLFVLSEEFAHVNIGGYSLNTWMILGGLMLITGHAMNIHACHCFCDKTCHHDDHAH